MKYMQQKYISFSVSTQVWNYFVRNKAHGRECTMHFPICPFHRSHELFYPTQMRGIAFKKKRLHVRRSCNEFCSVIQPGRLTLN